MTPHGTFIEKVLSLIAMLGLATIPAPAVALSSTNEGPAIDQPDSAGQATSQVHGIINRDTTWRGHVMVTDDVTIIGTTVHVEPGTLIEFANADHPPTISVGTTSMSSSTMRRIGAGREATRTTRSCAASLTTPSENS